MSRASRDRPLQLPRGAGAVADAASSSHRFDFDARVASAPKRPGVYLMRDRQGQVVYVGKAIDLRARLNQYRLQQDTRFFVHLLEDVLGEIEVIVTQTDKEALLLENELVKRHQPRFNVLLKDDKNFIHLRLATEHDFPRLEIVRSPKDDGARYYGPYASASAARSTLREVNRHFQLRTCSDTVFRNRQRPCLEHQIDRCSAPCVLPDSQQSYVEDLADVHLFLSGRGTELIDEIQLRMRRASERQDYESAARLRDQWRAIKRSLEGQHVKLLDSRRDMDAIALYRQGARSTIALAQVRQGALVGVQGFALRDQEFPSTEVLSGFLVRHYDGGAEIPDELLIEHRLEEADVLATWLTEIRNARRAIKRSVRLHTPQRGDRAKVLALAQRNAKQVFRERLGASAAEAETLQALGSYLAMSKLPRRIECYDVSNIQGTDPVASMVVFVDGAPLKSAYRSFRIRSKDTPDDFAMMYETLVRRLERIDQPGWERPDLIIVDGGPPQLRMAVAAMDDLAIHGIEVAGLAKARSLSKERGRTPERLWSPGAIEPLVLDQNSKVVFLLARMRDEAHRFAISHHRKRRRGRTLQSALDQIEGVGPARRRALLREFGSVRALSRASVDRVAAVPGVGPKLAQRICDVLQVGEQVTG
ncbi:MAG: excinuclease ABC subunit C [Myxococcales bacterium]|nr:excinuclease ABC subunit C [Myxococcales bacterium]